RTWVPIRSSLHRLGPSVWAIALTPDGRTLALGGFGVALQLWDMTTRKPRLVLHPEVPGTVTALACAPNGRLLASSFTPLPGPGQEDQPRAFVELREIATGKTCATRQASCRVVSAMSWSPDGTLLASASEDKLICLWDGAKAELLTKIEG